MKDINFLISESALEKGNLEAQNKDMTAQKIVIIVLCVTFAVAILFAPGFYLGSIKKQITAVEAQINDAKFREVRSVKAQLASITAIVDGKKAIINGIDSRSVPSSQILASIESALPSGCYLSSVSFAQNSVEVKGIADSSLLAAEFMGNLDRLTLFTRMTDSIQIEQAQSPISYNIKYIVAEVEENKK